MNKNKTDFWSAKFKSTLLTRPCLDLLRDCYFIQIRNFPAKQIQVKRKSEDCQVEPEKSPSLRFDEKNDFRSFQVKVRLFRLT